MNELNAVDPVMGDGTENRPSESRLLMASRVPHFSGKTIGRVPREYVSVVLVGVAAALLILFNFPMQTLVAVTLAYLASIPFAVRRYRALERAAR